MRTRWYVPTSDLSVDDAFQEVVHEYLELRGVPRDHERHDMVVDVVTRLAESMSDPVTLKGLRQAVTTMSGPDTLFPFPIVGQFVAYRVDCDCEYHDFLSDESAQLHIEEEEHVDVKVSALDSYLFAATDVEFNTDEFQIAENVTAAFDSLVLSQLGGNFPVLVRPRGLARAIEEGLDSAGVDHEMPDWREDS